jgi:hypothetical protein
MALRISRTGAVYYDDPFMQELEAGREHDLLTAFGSTDTLPPMDSAYWRRAGKMIAEGVGCLSELGSAMLQIIKTHGEEGSFQPEELVFLVEAFDEAWQQFEKNDVHFASDHELQQARNKLGKYIIDQAKKGERDKAVLRDGALLAYGQSVQQLRPRK